MRSQKRKLSYCQRSHLSTVLLKIIIKLIIIIIIMLSYCISGLLKAIPHLPELKTSKQTYLRADGVL